MAHLMVETLFRALLDASLAGFSMSGTAAGVVGAWQYTLTSPDKEFVLYVDHRGRVSWAQGGRQMESRDFPDILDGVAYAHDLIKSWSKNQDRC
jgi:hypothetical protein